MRLLRGASQPGLLFPQGKLVVPRKSCGDSLFPGDCPAWAGGRLHGLAAVWHAGAQGWECPVPGQAVGTPGQEPALSCSVFSVVSWKFLNSLASPGESGWRERGPVLGLDTSAQGPGSVLDSWLE